MNAHVQSSPAKRELPAVREPRVEVREVVMRAHALQPLLRSKQAEAEARGYPDAEVAGAIREAGLFRLLTPRAYGGYELTLPDFYAVVMEIARGCPSTGWWYALGAGHSVQIASYMGREGQDAIFGKSPDFAAPLTFSTRGPRAVRVDGGWRVTGKWGFASGVPHSDYFMGGMTYPDAEGRATGKNDADVNLWATEMLVVIVPRGEFQMLEDWGDLIGMRASGSNSVVLDDVFVPDHLTFSFNRARLLFGDTVGSALHDSNPLYAGSFNAFAEGSLAAVSVGLAEAAIDEFTAIVTRGQMPGTGGVMKMDLPEVRRSLGIALAKGDMVRSAVLRGAQIYMEAARRSVEKVQPFTNETSLRLDGMYHAIHHTVGEIIEMLLRSASTSSLRDGSPMQRYFRDAVMLRTRREQLDLKALEIAREYFEQEGLLAG